MENVQNHELQLAYDFIQLTSRNVFLTGKAGTGKTTFLHNLKKASPKRMIVVAPTGVAAINAGGVTIHSFFQLPFHPHVPAYYTTPGHDPDRAGDKPQYKVSREKIRIMKSIDLLVIDEISMVRADLLDAVDSVLRRYKDGKQPFGGVQLLMIGDLQQLAPVVREDDREILGRYYETAFFFSSHALRATDYITIELKHVYRQRDVAFISLLNKIRNNCLDESALKELNRRYDPNFDPDSNGGYITLTTHNAQAQALNDTRLKKLPGRERLFKAIIRDDFPEFAYPTVPELCLKADAQVMFVKNDISREKLYFNGKIGRVLKFDGDSIVVQCPGDEQPIVVEMAEWQNMKYTLDEKSAEIQETVIGTFVQYPLKLAWAITIHKSQGLTFDRAIIDAQAAFTHGQVYVALSRCRTLEGLVLSTPVSRRGIISDAAVDGFVQEVEQHQPGQEELARSIKVYQQHLLHELFDFSAIQKQVFYCLKLVRENQTSLLGRLENDLEQMGIMVGDLAAISGKFNPQLQHLISGHPDAENNEPLQDRVKKACLFFSGRMSGIFDGLLNGIQVDTDNRDLRKTIDGILEKMLGEVSVKMACLENCKSGFGVKSYLEAKARASIGPPATRARAVKVDEEPSAFIEHPELFNRLKAWRNQHATRLNKPVYMILPQKTLASLSNQLPLDSGSLIAIKGMGKKKTAQFGKELLELIAVYCEGKNITPTPVRLPDKKIAKVKTDTRHTSLSLFRSGLTVDQIARERAMAVNTIENHLAHFIGTGELPVMELVSRETLDLIIPGFIKQGNYLLNPLKAELGDRVSWSDLRYVARYLEFLDKQSGPEQTGS